MEEEIRAGQMAGREVGVESITLNASSGNRQMQQRNNDENESVTVSMAENGHSEPGEVGGIGQHYVGESSSNLEERGVFLQPEPWIYQNENEIGLGGMYYQPQQQQRQLSYQQEQQPVGFRPAPHGRNHAHGFHYQQHPHRHPPLKVQVEGQPQQFSQPMYMIYHPEMMGNRFQQPPPGIQYCYVQSYGPPAGSGGRGPTTTTSVGGGASSVPAPSTINPMQYYQDGSSRHHHDHGGHAMPQPMIHMVPAASYYYPPPIHAHAHAHHQPMHMWQQQQYHHHHHMNPGGGDSLSVLSTSANAGHSITSSSRSSSTSTTSKTSDTGLTSQQDSSKQFAYYSHEKIDNKSPQQSRGSRLVQRSRTEPSISTQSTRTPAGMTRSRSYQQRNINQLEAAAENDEMEASILDSTAVGSTSPTRKQSTTKVKRSQYRGVSWHKRDRKWLARLWANERIEHLGTFQSEKMAALAVDLRSLEHFGDQPKKVLNFDAKERELLTIHFKSTGEFKIKTLKSQAQIERHKTKTSKRVSAKRARALEEDQQTTASTSTAAATTTATTSNASSLTSTTIVPQVDEEIKRSKSSELDEDEKNDDNSSTISTFPSAINNVDHHQMKHDT